MNSKENSVSTKTRPSFKSIYMAFAESLAERSTCSRLQVGTVITTADFRQVVALGYNGGAAGQKNECDSNEPGQCGHLHSEINAIISCAHHGPKVVFVTHQPCEMCAKALVNLHQAHGPIETVYFKHPYRLTAGIRVLKHAGVDVLQLDAEGREWRAVWKPE